MIYVDTVNNGIGPLRVLRLGYTTLLYVVRLSQRSITWQQAAVRIGRKLEAESPFLQTGCQNYGMFLDRVLHHTQQRVGALVVRENKQ